MESEVYCCFHKLRPLELIKFIPSNPILSPHLESSTMGPTTDCICMYILRSRDRWVGRVAREKIIINFQLWMENLEIRARGRNCIRQNGDVEIDLEDTQCERMKFNQLLSVQYSAFNVMNAT
jgi:hypothetical protein